MEKITHYWSDKFRELIDECKPLDYVCNEFIKFCDEQDKELQDAIKNKDKDFEEYKKQMEKEKNEIKIL